jgi:hypothetical protein
LIDVAFDLYSVEKDLKNVVEYSIGFLDGAKNAEPKLAENLGKTVIETFKQFVDSNARVDPQSLAHVYEWYQTGSPEARLFDLSYEMTGPGLTISSTFRQSSTIESGSNTPFYDKARIMEAGLLITISPKKSSVLVFDDNGEKVFTKNPVTVDHPGGPKAQGGFQRVLDEFFNRYFTQSFIKASGIFSHLENPLDFKKNFAYGVRGGRSIGLNTGYNWASRAGVLN